MIASNIVEPLAKCKSDVPNPARRYAWPDASDKDYRASPGSEAQKNARLLLAELERIYADSYGETLPENGKGLLLLTMALHCIREQGGDVVGRCMGWTRLWAPWLASGYAEIEGRDGVEAVELGDLIADVIANPRHWSAQARGNVLGLAREQRTRLNITMTRPCNMTGEAFAAMQREQGRLREARRRRRNGAVPRAEYLAKSKTRQAQAEGISRSTLYRRLKAAGAGAPPPVEQVRVEQDRALPDKKGTCRTQPLNTGSLYPSSCTVTDMCHRATPHHSRAGDGQAAAWAQRQAAKAAMREAYAALALERERARRGPPIVEGGCIEGRAVA